MRSSKLTSSILTLLLPLLLIASGCAKPRAQAQLLTVPTVTGSTDPKPNEVKFTPITKPTPDSTPSPTPAPPGSTDSLRTNKFEIKVDGATKQIKVKTELAFGKLELGQHEFDGAFDEQGFSTLKTSDNRLKASAMCLDEETCEKIAVTFYYEINGKTHTVQLVSDVIPNARPKPPPSPSPNPLPTPTPTPEPQPTPPSTDDDYEEHEPEQTYEEYVGLPPIDVPGVPPTTSQAVNKHSNGSLKNAISLPGTGPGYVFRSGAERESPAQFRWGTQSMISLIQWVSDQTFRKFRDRPILLVKSISAKNGGRIPAYKIGNKVKYHFSHQNGLDADLSLPSKNPYNPAQFPVMVEKGRLTGNLDVERLWYMAMLLQMKPEVSHIYTGFLIKDALCAHVKQKYGRLPVHRGSQEYEALRQIRRLGGHENHLHVRLQCPSTSPRCQKIVPHVEKDTGCK